MSVTYQKFKEAFPLHNQPYNPKLENWYKAALVRKRMEDPGKKIEQDAALLALYDDWASKRAVTPENGKKSLSDRLSVILQAFPGTVRIYLQGSRAKGDWVDQKTPVKWMKMREAMTGKVKPISDWDFYIEPEQSATIGDIHIMPFKTKEATLVYGNL